MPDILSALRDQSALVKEIRDSLFPDGQPLHDPAKALLFTQHVAWQLRGYGVGLVRAKPGSENNVHGYTTDVVALENGVHWDVQRDGHTGAAFAQWSLVPQFADDGSDNYAAVAPRWTPAVKPAGTSPIPGPATPETAPAIPSSPSGGLDIGPAVHAVIAAAVAPLRAEIAALRAELAAINRSPPAPARIAIRTAHGTYLSAQPDGRLVADRDSPGPWETFDEEPQ